MTILRLRAERSCTTLRAMAKTYRPYVPEQDLLLPPSLRDWLPEDHLAYFVSDLVDQLDLSAITAVYEDEERGLSAVSPGDADEGAGVRATASACSRRGRFSDGWSKTWRFACWRRAMNRTFAPSPIFARRTWRR